VQGAWEATQVGRDQLGADVGGQVGQVQRERQPVQPAQPFDVHHVGALRQAEAAGHRPGGPDRTEGPDLVDHLAVLVQGLGQALQPVQPVRHLAGHHERPGPGHPTHQSLTAQQVERLVAAPDSGGDVLQNHGVGATGIWLPRHYAI
jgi:hypothetical protein